ncbi:MAG: transcriptional antiterminator, BglG family [Lachnospiraceae bacterium]|nr:transcriptional antiterminator, BglG family [Lachnospiraceae bacterium]
MEIVKIINNNIVSSIDIDGEELVVMGRGLGFQCKTGQAIDETKVEKIFRMDNNGQTRQLGDLLADVPLEHIQLANSIITDARDMIVNKMNKNLYITLIDHISFAIERFKQGILFTNPLLWEIKKFYPQEFKAGLNAVKKINAVLDILLTEDEAASIAMHFVNAELGTDMPHAIDATKIIQNIINIVKDHVGMVINEESLSYERFLTHLKFFAQRIVTNDTIYDTDNELNDIIKHQYPNEYKCAEKIRIYVESEFHVKVPEEEMTYLTVHIRRIIADKNNKKEEKGELI